MIKLPDELVELLRQPSICHLCTLMPDGSPQITQTWVDTDGERVIINSVPTHVKVKNVTRDPRVAVAISNREAPGRSIQIRGRVVSVTTEGAVDHIELLSQKYTGKPYNWYTGRELGRVMIVIEPEKVSGMRR